MIDLGVDQPDVAHLHAGEVGTLELRAGEIHLPELRAAQVRIFEVSHTRSLPE